MNQKIPPELRQLLAELYPDERSIRRLVADAGLDVSTIPIDAHALNSWHAVLAEAAKHHQVAALLARAESEYPNNQPLRHACQVYRQVLVQAGPGQVWPPMRFVGIVSFVLIIVGGYWVYGKRNSAIPVATPTITVPATAEVAAIGVAASATASVATATTLAESATLTPTVMATANPTTATAASVPAGAAVAGLRILDNGLTDNTYIIEGMGSAQINVGADLVVYGEPNPGTEVAIARLLVVGKNPETLTAQALLIDPAFKIRTRMRVDDNLAYLAESQLVPVFDYVVGYLLRPGRVRLRPDHGLAVGTSLQALAFERSGEAIIDAFPLTPASRLQITALGVDREVAAVELLTGTWPLTGTVVGLLPEVSSEESTITAAPPNTPPVENEQTFQVRYTPTELTGLIRPEPDVGTLSGNCSAFTYRGAASSFVITKVLGVEYIAMPGQPALAWAKVTYLDEGNTRNIAFFADAGGMLGILELIGGSLEIVTAFIACLE